MPPSMPPRDNKGRDTKAWQKNGKLRFWADKNAHRTINKPITKINFTKMNQLQNQAPGKGNTTTIHCMGNGEAICATCARHALYLDHMSNRISDRPPYMEPKAKRRKCPNLISQSKHTRTI